MKFLSLSILCAIVISLVKIILPNIIDNKIYSEVQIFLGYSGIVSAAGFSAILKNKPNLISKEDIKIVFFRYNFIYASISVVVLQFCFVFYQEQNIFLFFTILIIGVAYDYLSQHALQHDSFSLAVKSEFILFGLYLFLIIGVPLEYIFLLLISYIFLNTYKFRFEYLKIYDFEQEYFSSLISNSIYLLFPALLALFSSNSVESANYISKFYIFNLSIAFNTLVLNKLLYSNSLKIRSIGLIIIILLFIEIVAYLAVLKIDYFSIFRFNTWEILTGFFLILSRTIYSFGYISIRFIYSKLKHIQIEFLRFASTLILLFLSYLFCKKLEFIFLSFAIPSFLFGVIYLFNNEKIAFSSRSKKNSV